MAQFSDDDFAAPLPIPLAPGRRPSFSPSDEDQFHTHRPVPSLKRSSTASSTSRSHSHRHVDIENLPALPSSLSHWASPPSSLLSTQRRTSWAEVYEKSSMRRFNSEVLPMTSKAEFPDVALAEPHSPEDGTNLKRSLEINMKDLVGDAVGNMSISPSSRDIVLAARKGLFIIDLEHPFEVPRFLPQGGTWDVADVQWNPHPSRSQYIVSTSSEKMLIWNLGITGKTSIEHILKSHYRAITDFNWHTTECDVVASTGIDSWIWVWDLRNPRKPAFGLSAFKAGGTQVKWNRQDGNFLASSHGNEVLIWDRRKGSLPVTQITAHTAKIYGIDWSHHLRNEIVTCSLDTTIKSWDINEHKEPTAVIQTNYPVWRARNLPFGQGLLSLPQRGETRLEMYSRKDTQLVETFEGHSDVVKEFVWRKGGVDEFQLITWSKDRTLRFWPVTPDIMQKVGYMPEVPRGRSLRVEREPTLSYRNPPENPNNEFPSQQLLSAPIGNRSILAEVRAGPPPRSTNLITQPHTGSSARATTGELTPTLTDVKPVAVANRNRGGTMSRGAATGKSVAGMDAFAWLTNVKVGSTRGSSSGAGSGSAGPGSGNSSRLGSTSRAQSRSGRGDSESVRHRSPSRSRGADDRRESENAQSLQDEITSVLTKLSSSKIKLEKHDLTKKRTCTLGLHGPWGESSSVFMRVTFTFPAKYPTGVHPEGTPTVELERNPLISPRDRAYILKRLKAIRETKRPCLEACLRFLLFAEDGHSGRIGMIDSESSDEDDETGSKRKGKELTASMLRNHKNIAEPITSQGAFGPNGELICFFRAPPRIVRNVLRGFTENPAEEHQQQQQQQSQQQESLQQSRLFQSPALISDAIKRLRLAAKDQTVLAVERGKAENDLNILRAMTNLLTVSQHRIRPESGSNPKNYSLLPTRRSNVFMADTMSVAGPDKDVAAGYIFKADSLAELCDGNARVAQEAGRYDHERTFKTLRSLFQHPSKEERGKEVVNINAFVSDALAIRIVETIYTTLAKHKDIQMLAMLSAIVLQTPHGLKKPVSAVATKPSFPIADLPALKTSGMDYFTLARTLNNAPSPLSPAWPSPIAPTIAPSVSSSTSSRGSWSSLFNAGSVRQLMSGIQDGLTTPTELPAVLSSIPPEPLSKQNSLEKMVLSHAGAIQRKRARNDSKQSVASFMSKSWNEGQPPDAPPRALSVSFSSAGHKRSRLLRLADINPLVQEKRRIVFEPSTIEEAPPAAFTDGMIQQFHRHVYAYAELLFRWELFIKRLELLNAVGLLDPPVDEREYRIGLVRRCVRPECSMLLGDKDHICSHCGTHVLLPACTICRLPVKGLSRNCLRCCHVTHISCWNTLDVPICPTGCGCFCSGIEGVSTRPSTRLGLSPTSNSLMLSNAVS